MAHTVSLFGGNYSWATVVAGVILTLCVGLVVLGGIQRIAKVSEVIVPFMAVLYVGLAVIIIITNITAVPAALASIVKSAFTGSALAGLPFPSFVATFSLMLCLVFFAFTTILGWNYYGERCVEYLFNRNKGVVMGYRILYILAVFIGPYMTVKAVWNIADIFNALMAFPNLIALLALNEVIVKETRDFHAKHNGSY